MKKLKKRAKNEELDLSYFSPKQAALRKKNKQNPRMMNITINYPILYEDNIQKLLAQGIYPSRSEAVRIAIREFLYRELGFIKRLKK